MFNNPTATFIATEFLRTLDHENILSGYAEMLKHGLISTNEHFAELLNFDLDDIDYGLLGDMVGRSVEIKEHIVEEDPLEHGIRKALNLGHTAGHAFESWALTRKPCLHGYAVAWGLICDAIPGKGGNAEDLIFEWYYRFPEDSDFSRVSGGRDKKIRVVSYPSSGSSPDWDCGYYYCKVTDTATGKSTDSRIATVDVELSITDAKFSNLSTVVGCGEILYKMQGGCAPYTVEFWGYWTEGYMGQKTPTLAESIDMSYADPNTWYSSPAIPNFHDYIEYYGGMPKWRREFPTYCIVVVDALGQRIVYEDPDLHYQW